MTARAKIFRDQRVRVVKDLTAQSTNGRIRMISRAPLRLLVVAGVMLSCAGLAFAKGIKVAHDHHQAGEALHRRQRDSDDEGSVSAQERLEVGRGALYERSAYPIVSVWCGL